MNTSVQKWPALVITRGPDSGRSYTIGGEPVVLGRESGAAIVLPSDMVSRRHALVRNNGGTVTVEDPGSSNGTLVNGMRVVRPATLRLGDVIRLGDVELQFGVIGGRPDGGPSRSATYGFGDVDGPVLAGSGNRYVGGDQYVAGRDLHHGDKDDIDVTNDYDPWDEIWQGRGLGRLLMVLGALIALAGFVIWMTVIFSGFGDMDPTGPSPVEQEIFGIPAAVVGFSMFGGGGVLAAIGGGMSKAARKRAERRRRR